MAKYNYGSSAGSKKKKGLADSITSQVSLGGAYNSSKKPSKTDPDQYVPVPMDPTQAPRSQSGRRKVTKTTYASMARKKGRRRTGDHWIG